MATGLLYLARCSSRRDRWARAPIALAAFGAHRRPLVARDWSLSRRPANPVLVRSGPIRTDRRSKSAVPPKADLNSSFVSSADGLLTNHRTPSRRYHGGNRRCDDVAVMW
jgi:hypothetical protein